MWNLTVPHLQATSRDMKFKSALVTQVSGSVGGMTGASNQGGLYFRARAIPTNPNSPAQQATRAAFAALVQAWAVDLTEAQRQAWTTYGINTPTTDTLGNPLTLTGQQWFVGNNTARRVAGLADVNDGPTIFDTGEPITSINDAELDLGNVTIDLGLDTQTSEDGDVIFQTGPQQNASINFFKSPFRFTDTNAVPFASTTAQLVVDPNDFPFDEPDGGEFIPMRFRMAYDDGRLSIPFTQIVEITTAAPRDPAEGGRRGARSRRPGAQPQSAKGS